MSLLCKKTMKLNGIIYDPGDTIPEDAVMGNRLRALESSGYIVEAGKGKEVPASANQGAIYTQEEVDAFIKGAVNDALADMAQTAIGLEKIEPMEFKDKIQIPVPSDEEDSQGVLLLLDQEDIAIIFRIMQMNADNGARAIAEITNEDVLILLHAADSRKTIKDAAKKQAETLVSKEVDKNDAGNDNSKEESDKEPVTPQKQQGGDTDGKKL